MVQGRGKGPIGSWKCHKEYEPCQQESEDYGGKVKSQLDRIFIVPQ
jgi:hypothetical protein